MKSIKLLSILLASVIIAQPNASVPSVMSFQGMLTNVDGSSYEDGEYELIFRLIRFQQGGNEYVMWEETQTVNVSNGVFSAILGSITVLPSNVPGNAMLEIQVGDEVLTPRQPLTSVPFSFRSNRAQITEHAVGADTAQFAYHSDHATHADSSMFTVQSQHAVYADTASFVLNDGGMTNITDLSDALVEDNSIYIGNDPSSTTNEAEQNVSVGINALSVVTTGDKNTSVGYINLQSNTTGSKNTSIGNRSLKSNISGENNTAVGNESLVNNSTGSNNTANGSLSMYYNTTGLDNTAIGESSLAYNTTGNYNTAIGNRSLKVNNGDANVAVGLDALFNNTTGNHNTALGIGAGTIITTGNNNLVLGSDAATSAEGAENQIVIGYNATGHGNHITVIGNTDMTAIHPPNDDVMDLGSSNYEFKDLYVDGKAYVDTLELNGVILTASSTPNGENSIDTTFIVNGNLDVTGSIIMSVANVITESTTFNGSETIIPVYSTGTITIDSDQLVKGRILIFKSMTGVNSNFTIATEGAEQIQAHGNYLSDTISADGAPFEILRFFCDGSNWYQI